MTDRIEKVFTVAVKPAGRGPRSPTAPSGPVERDLRDRPRGWRRVRWTIGSIEGGRRGDRGCPREAPRQHEQTGHANSEITVTFEAVASGTRISITHAGFGDGPWDEWIEGTSLGWDQAIADLVAYLETGVAAGPFRSRSSTRRMKVVETMAGLRVDEVSEGRLGHQAGVPAGDLLLTVGGAAIYRMNELWVICRDRDLERRGHHRRVRPRR